MWMGKRESNWWSNGGFAVFCRYGARLVPGGERARAPWDTG